MRSLPCPHTLEARLSRWLLRCDDLLGSNDIPLTQEFLGEMLGVRRTSDACGRHVAAGWLHQLSARALVPSPKRSASP
jgi:hypothetical protein